MKTQQDSLQKAFRYAAVRHKNQKRYSGEPYILHCMGVFDRIRLHKLPIEYQQAALLHDVIEDTNTTYKQIVSVFGQKVASMVYLLSKPKKHHFYREKNGFNKRLDVYLQQLFKGVKKHPGLLIIKICDQLDNLQSITVFPEQKYYRIIWTLKLNYLPLYQYYAENSVHLKSFDKPFIALYRDLLTTIDCLLSEPYRQQKSIWVSENKFLSRGFYQFYEGMRVENNSMLTNF